MLFKFLPNVRANGNPGSIVSDRNSTVVEEHRPKAMQQLVIAGAVGGGGGVPIRPMVAVPSVPVMENLVEN